jgi:serpin B
MRSHLLRRAGTATAAIGLLAACGTAHHAAVPKGLHIRATSGSAIQLVAETPAKPTTAGFPAELTLAQREQEFSLKLLQASATDQNLTLSPTSLAIALSMLNLGAAANTQEQITKALATTGLSADDQARGWAALSADWSADAARSKVSLQSANSLWLQDNLPMKTPYMSALADYFDTGIWQVDFTNQPAKAAKAIDAWVAKQTKKKITSLFKPSDFNRDTRLVLANAIYFKAAWEETFDPHSTGAGPFSLASGATSSAQFMHNNTEQTFAVSRTATYDAAELPYQGGRFAALVVKPTTGTLSQFVDSLTQPTLARIAASLRTQPVNLALPKFTLSGSTLLNSALKTMGVSDAFSGAADFAPMSSTPLRVYQVLQKTYLKVDETGTEAAAVTGINTGATAVAPPKLSITFDHPFLLIIRDTATGAILFESEIQNPAG